MGKIISIDPITRISGFLEINAMVDNNVITDAAASGLLFRGFEKMLSGRPPLDAVYFTERVCGICSAAHAAASSLALEDALGIIPDKNSIYITDLIHGFEFLQNHLRQFFLYAMPDYVRLPDMKPFYPQSTSDLRLPEDKNNIMVRDYFAAIKYSSLAHEGQAVFGGKAPHNHGILPGGVSVNLDSYKIEKVKSIISSIKDFIRGRMVEDVYILAKYYPDYFEIGTSYPNYMSFGIYDFEDPEISYVKPGVFINGTTFPLNPERITENIKYTWYTSSSDTFHPGTGSVDNIDMKKEMAYTFIKAPRYDGLPMEVGPLARMFISGGYRRGNSAMDRNIARVLEAKKISDVMEKLCQRIVPGEDMNIDYQIPDEAFGAGLVDTTRGALGHWIYIKDKKINHYEIITPTGWNLSPKDINGINGPVEKALTGIRIGSTADTPEIGRVVRSFDPCVSCATHVLSKEPSQG